MWYHPCVISIKDTAGSMWVPCPKCKSAVCITQWGEQTCIYEKCDGHKFTFEFTPDIALLMLEQIQKANIQERNTPKAPLMRPAMPKLQKSTDCYLLVPQPDSINPADWYHNDPFKPKK